MYTPSEIATIINAGHIRQGESTVIETLEIDSRKINNGRNCLFFAIKSEKNDGHKYLPELLEKGVRNFVITDRKAAKILAGCNVYLVNDCIAALQDLAIHHRSRFNLPVIGITGSNGKTIVKEWLWQMSHQDFSIVRSPKSYNSQVGVPLSVWLINDHHNLGIFEAGISKPDEMEKIERVIKPSLGIITNIGPAHEKNFSSEREKIREKLKLFKNCETVILPADDEKILREWMKTGYPANTLGWSFRKKGNLNLRRADNGKLHCQWKGVEFEVNPPYKDEASVENLAVCIITCLFLGISPEKLTDRIASLSPVGMRLEMLEGINNTLLVNDAYSADLSSLQIALDFLNQQNQHEKKTLILSDILEAGTKNEVLYQKVANLCKEKNISRVIGIGPAISQFSASFPQGSTFYNTTEDFLKTGINERFSNESILIKGARVFTFERITKALQRKAHETVLEINLNAIHHNFSFFKTSLEVKKLMAMVKAAAYGAGNIEIAKLLEYNRVDYLGVAYTNEGIDLRKAGVNSPIMVMNPDQENFDLLLQYKLEPEIFNFSGLKNLLYALSKSKKKEPFPIHLKIDTGMHRLGFVESEIADLINDLKGNSSIIVASAFSHLAAADDPKSDAFTRQQIKSFDRTTGQLEKALGYSFLKHIANTAGATRFPEAAFDMVRIGIGLYGISPVEETRNRLLPAGRLKTHISQIRHIKAGESVGYNRRHKAGKDETIATLPIGYADGVPRRLGNSRFKVWISGRLAPVIGSVCMDMCMIDVTGIACEEGDEVIIFGPEWPIETMAKELDTIPYEVLTGISSRVKRVFYQE